MASGSLHQHANPSHLLFTTILKGPKSSSAAQGGPVNWNWLKLAATAQDMAWPLTGLNLVVRWRNANVFVTGVFRARGWGWRRRRRAHRRPKIGDSQNLLDLAEGMSEVCSRHPPIVCVPRSCILVVQQHSNGRHVLCTGTGTLRWGETATACCSHPLASSSSSMGLWHYILLGTLADCSALHYSTQNRGDMDSLPTRDKLKGGRNKRL